MNVSVKGDTEADRSGKRKRSTEDIDRGTKRKKPTPDVPSHNLEKATGVGQLSPSQPKQEDAVSGADHFDDPMDIDPVELAPERPQRRRPIAKVRQQKAAAKKSGSTPSRSSRQSKLVLTSEGVPIAFASKLQQTSDAIDEDESMVDSSYMSTEHAAEAAQRREGYDSDQRQADYAPNEYLAAARTKFLDRQ